MSFIERQQEKSLGELLVQSGRLTKNDLQKALGEQQRHAEPLGKTLVRLGFVQEKDITQVLLGLLVVTFHLGDELFAFEALFVREIIRWVVVNKLPRMPKYIEGILRHRDMVMPVINLAQRLGKDPIPGNEESRIIIVDCASQLFGLAVDGVDAVIQLPFDRIESSPTILQGIESQYVYGVGKHEDRLITVLHLENILAIVSQDLPSLGEHA
jgi:purine-binding chemotaxis protein CheW